MTDDRTDPDLAEAAIRDDLRRLEAEAETLRREGRAAAADQLLAWRDLHAMRLPRASGGRSGGEG